MYIGISHSLVFYIDVMFRNKVIELNIELKNDILQPPHLSSHSLCTYTHIRLQNKIIYVPVNNDI